MARRRGLLAAGLAAGAVATALPTLVPTPLSTTQVLTAARDLAPGSAVVAADVVTVDLPVIAVPDGALTTTSAALGRTPTGAVRRGEPLTDVRFVGAGLLAGLGPDLVAVPVRLADPAAATLLGAGDHVDILGAAPQTGEARVVAKDLLVLAVPATATTGEGAMAVVAAARSTAVLLAGAGAVEQLSAAVRPR